MPQAYYQAAKLTMFAHGIAARLSQIATYASGFDGEIDGGHKI